MNITNLKVSKVFTIATVVLMAACHHTGHHHHNEVVLTPAHALENDVLPQPDGILPLVELAGQWQTCVNELTLPLYEGRDAGTTGYNLACGLVQDSIETIPHMEPAFVTGWRQSFELDLSRGSYFPWSERKKTYDRLKHEQNHEWYEQLRRGRTVRKRLHPQPTVCWNVGGMITGHGELAEQVVIVGAHLDHIGMGFYGSRDAAVRAGELALHPGADDNASGSSAIYMVAHAWGDWVDAHLEESRPTVVFVWFGAEERGLHGSYHLSTHPQECAFDLSQTLGMICPDMVGSAERNVGHVFSLENTEGLFAASAFAAAEDVASDFEIIFDQPAPGSSDDLTFAQIGIESALLSVAVCEDGLLQSLYHTPADTADMMNATAAAWMSRYILSWIGHLSQVEEDWSALYKKADATQNIVFF